jgi:hypothetical protein
LVGSIYERSSIQIAHFILIRLQTLPSQAILVSETGMPVAAMFVYGSGRNYQSLWRTFNRCFLPSLGSFGKSVSEEKIFLEIIQSETRIVNMATTGNYCF